MILTKEHQSLVVLVGLGALGVYLISRIAAQQAAKAAQAVSPLNRDNIFYSGVNGVGAVVSGDEHFTLGGAVYDWFHGGEIEAVTNGTQ